jgi:hypothetical protein
MRYHIADRVGARGGITLTLVIVAAENHQRDGARSI